MINRKLVLLLVLVLASTLTFAADEYKPYLHKPVVPEHPQVRLFGQYSTNLFPGSATYQFNIEIPKGINGMQPEIVLLYNSQSVMSKPSIIGAGWSLDPNFIYRDINYTLNDWTDDRYFLVLGGNQYELIYGSDSKWHTEVEYFFKIENNTDGSWLVTQKDGKKFRFGYNPDTYLTVDGKKIKCMLDQAEDTNGNKVYYHYNINPNAEDKNAVYLDTITYNNDEERKILFMYEGDIRPDYRDVYDQGLFVKESRRLTHISVFSGTDLVRRYELSYITLSDSLTSIKKIIQYGSDNVSQYYDIEFSYGVPVPGYTKLNTSYKSPVLFSNDNHDDYGVRQLDLNNDGFIDMVQAKGGTTRKTWINNKTNGWDESNSYILPIDIVTSSNVDEGVRFADINNDGYIDLIKSKAGTRVVYINNRTGWQNVSYNIPVDFVDSSGIDQGVVLDDVNGDGKIDIIKSKAGSRSIYLGNGAGWSLSNLVFPTDILDSNAKDLGVRIVDVNGDGLSDILKGYAGTRQAWINNGTGFKLSDDWIPPTDFVTSSNPDNGVRLLDVNGDGLIDLLVDFFNGTTQNSGAWLNTGHGWAPDISWQSPEAFTKNGYNIGRRLLDVNGDGSADIVVSHQDSNNQYTWIKNSSVPFMLSSIKNAYGGATNISYTSSTKFNNSGEIGFNIFVVSNITTSNGIDVFGYVNYSYAYGKYLYDTREFRGFGFASESDISKTINHYFHQDNPRRGREYKTEIYDNDGLLYTVSETGYNWTRDSDGIYNLTMTHTQTASYDGSNDPIIRNITYNYDGYDNIGEVYDYGDVSVSGDEKKTIYTYAYNKKDWIMDRPASVTVYDSIGSRISETRNYYDNRGLKGMGSHGLLTKTEQWNSLGNNSFTYYDYDSYGNLITQTDSLGRTTKFAYDETHMYLVSTVNPIGHVEYYSYDLGTGNLLWKKKNDIKTSYQYDNFGRVTKEILPYDTSAMPTKKYVYNFDGTAPESITVHLKTVGSNYENITYAYDGLGNLIELDSKGITKKIYYDQLGRVIKEDNPKFISDSETVNSTQYKYDPLDRIVKVINPDGSNKRIFFNKTQITDYDENNNRHKYILDGLGRIISVREYNLDHFGEEEEYITSYAYDGNDNLIEITDEEGNKFSFTYDSLGRKIAMSDPDLGNWTYEYDQVGNLIRQTDARSEVIELFYDDLNRVILKQSDDVNITFNYDAQYYGMLDNISMDNILYSYSYDDRFRMILEDKNIDGINFDTSFIYDSQNRMISVEGLRKIDYILNQQGKVKKIPGFVTDASFNAFGSILNRSYANGIITSFEYDTENGRLLNINSAVQNVSYAYDFVGNVMSYNDSEHVRIMDYDNLDRLVKATIDGDVYTYSFNPIGNILKLSKNNQSTKLVYSSGLAHAPAKIIQGELGSNVYGIKDLNTASKNRIIEFFVENENSDPNSMNLSVLFGDGSSVDKNGIEVNDELWVLMKHNYSKGGDYKIDVLTSSETTGDDESIFVKFGTRAKSLLMLLSNATHKQFEFLMGNDVIEPVHNVSFDCSNGFVMNRSAELSGLQDFYAYFRNTYDSPGQKELTCTVYSDDGSESKTLKFRIDGAEMQDYDILNENISERIVAFDIKNQFKSMPINLSIKSELGISSVLSNLSEGQDILVFFKTNYSTDGMKSIDVEITGENNYSNKYVETFLAKGVKIENYNRLAAEYTDNVIMFDVVNDWHDGEVNVSLNDLDINVNLSTSDKLFVFVKQNGTKQGNSRAEVTAQISEYQDELKNAYYIKPIEIVSLSSLDGLVSEAIVSNNRPDYQVIDFMFTTGNDQIENSGLNVSDKIFIFIKPNVTEDGVYRSRLLVNSSLYEDERTGVMIR